MSHSPAAHEESNPMSNQQHQNNQNQAGEGSGYAAKNEGSGLAIDFDSDEPIKACALRPIDDGEICESCQ